MKAVIFANGQMTDKPVGLDDFSSFDLIVAADGGLAHCGRLGVVPHIVVGDMDSAEKSDLEELADSGVEIDRHPGRKDETDLELALKAALDRGADEIVILGALGARWDMTFGNVIGLGAEFLDDTEVKILDGATEITRVKGGRTLVIEGRPGDRLSVVPVGGDAKGITLEGLEYPLDDENLAFGSTRGLSNVFNSRRAKIRLEKGMLLVSVQRRPDRTGGSH